MLTDVFDRMVQDFKARSCPAEILWGEHHKTDHGNAPRVIVYPGTDTYGARASSNQGPWPLRGANPRAVGTRYYGGVANIWGAGPEQRDPAAQNRADFGVVDALINQTAMSLHVACTGMFTITGGEFVNDESQVRRGLVYEMTFDVQVPILDIPWPAVAINTSSKTFAEGTVTTVDADVEFEDPE